MCGEAGDCDSGLCAIVNGGRRCLDACVAGVCPVGYDCHDDLVLTEPACLRFDARCAGEVELDCADALDDEGDLLTDCADPDCLNRACGAERHCRAGGVCRG